MQDFALPKFLLATCLFNMVCGCYSSRISAIPLVRDMGCQISTRYRYRLVSIYSGASSRDCRAKQEFLEKCYPGVFSDCGMPFVVRYRDGYSSFRSKYGWSIFLCLCSCCIMPEFHRYEWEFSFEIEMLNDNSVRSPFKVVCTQECCGSPMPTGLIPFTGELAVDGHRVFCRSEKKIGEELQHIWRLSFSLDDQISSQAFAYAVAVKLKELENEGNIDAMLQKHEVAKSKAPAHKVMRFVRESGSDFTYGFTLELAEMPANPDTAASAVISEFGESVKAEYVDAFPRVKKEALVVNYAGVRIDGKTIHGQATVLTIVPISLTYDAITRRGFNAGQVEEARAWIRKNIETLARDKNIALTTGTLPPEATYYSLGEKIDGNVMEIEFRTE